MPILDAPVDDATYVALDWHSLAERPEERHAQWAFAQKFFGRAAERADAGEQLQAQALQVLGGAISMHMQNTSHAAFGPMWQMGNQRSLAMEDLGEHDIALLARAARDSPQPWLRARFADVALSADGRVPPNWQLGVIAANAYLEYAQSVFGTDWAMDGLDEIRRGLVLARAFAKKDEALWQRYWESILEEAPHAIGLNGPGLIFQLCSEALSRSQDACAALAPQIEAKAVDLDTDAPRMAADWHEYAYKLRWRLGERAAANASLMARGEALVRAAEIEPQALLAAMLLTEAIQVLRRAKPDPSYIRELRDRLAQKERASLDAYSSHTHQFDATDVVKWVDQQIGAPTFFESLLRMAYHIGHLIHYEKGVSQLRESAEKHPFSKFFGSMHANAQGAMVARSEPLNLDDPNSIRRHVIQNAVQFELPFRAQIVVSRAASVIHATYHPSFDAIREVVDRSIMSPRSQIETLSRGLFAGFIDDWLAASAYLVPAMEPFIRHQIQRAGGHTATIDEEGVQRERTLGELLAMEEAKQFFGERLIFEFEIHLTDPDGINLRNAYCHGLLSDEELDGTPGIRSLWWLIWRMILFPWHEHVAPPAVEKVDPGVAGREDAHAAPD